MEEEEEEVEEEELAEEEEEEEEVVVMVKEEVESATCSTVLQPISNGKGQFLYCIGTSLLDMVP